MNKLDKHDARAKINELSAQSKPFVFFVDFDQENVIISEHPTEDDIYFDFSGHSNIAEIDHGYPVDFYFEKYPIQYSEYEAAFDRVMMHLKRGDSYLVNLAFPTLIKTNLTLKDLFYQSVAKFKAYIPGQFAFFSPERFIDIIGDQVTTYPMKGTIDADIPNAEEIILNDSKELAEHSTVVDLLRNDLSQICDQVRVSRFRYIDEIVSNNKKLLQVSSEITGKLQVGLSGYLGGILFKMLPAGSITGAPKRKTVDIIKSIEASPRQYYTGVCGHYDGTNLRSGVMIRMIQLDDQNNMYYYSGGGITAQSNPQSEYQELIDKVYVPITRDHQNQRRSDMQHRISQQEA